ncbi:MAG TPA: NAD(P)/FAD-dependent oxidoreductase [Aldersonia sp.]
MNTIPSSVDVLVIGAGFGGIYAVAKFKQQGMSVACLDQNDGPGGAWNQNRYPGARVDSNSRFYAMTHDPDVYQDWTPREEFSDSAEMRRYFEWLVERLGVDDDIAYGRTVTRAAYDESTSRWEVATADGAVVEATYLVLAIGSLNTPNAPQLPGQDVFAGTVVHTSSWPATEVPNLHGRVGVVGTGSSGIQVATQLSATAEKLYVLQRTPQYTLPLGNHPADPAERDAILRDFAGTREQIFAAPKGRPVPETQYALAALPADEQQRLLEEGWNQGGNILLGMFTDLFTDPNANDVFSDFVRAKIRSTVTDPETAELLTPTYGIGAKRIVRDSGFYHALNRPNTHLVSLAGNPIVELTETGLQTENEHIELDVLVMATGFDAMTGPLFRIDLYGENGVLLEDQWNSGERIDSMGGLMVNGFPNMFIIGGAQSPAVHVSVPVLNEYMVDQASDIIDLAQAQQAGSVQPPVEYCTRWTELVTEAGQGSITNTVASWFNGGNIDGKPRAFLTYQGGFVNYQTYFNGLDKQRLLEPPRELAESAAA